MRRLGLVQVGTQWRGTCPACGYGSNAFMLSFNRDGSARGWCISCRDREKIDQALGDDAIVHTPVDPKVKALQAAKMQMKARERWRTTVPVAGTPAEAYLEWRGLPWLADSLALRYAAVVSRPQTLVRFPAMIAAVAGPKGDLVGVHRTYLTLKGRKAPGDEPVKASLGPVWGGAIQLEPWQRDKPLVIGEGIETAASAGRMLEMPAWASISAGNMQYAMVLPKEVRKVIIAADPGRPGEEAAHAARDRWEGEGREVQIVLPDGKGDFNDVLKAQRRRK